MRRAPRTLPLATGVLLLAALGAACGDDDVSLDAAALDGTEWGDPVVEGYELAGTLTFTFDGDTISVGGGCNDATGTFTLEDGRLSTGPLATTLMACEGGLMEQDAWIGGLLADGLDADLEDDTLTLTSGATTITLRSTT